MNMVRKRLLVNLLLLLTYGYALSKESVLEYGFPPVVRGSGAVFFAVEEGKPLELKISKRDLNRSTRTTANLYAWLLSPDRTLLAELNLSDDGLPAGSGRGPVVSGTINTGPLPAGFYMLYIVTTGMDAGDQDSEVIWGVRTNCPRYMIMRSEGADGRGNTPVRIMAAEEEDGVEIFFRAPASLNRMTLTNYGGVSGEIKFLDENGNVIAAHVLSGEEKEKISLPGERAGQVIGLSLPAGDYSISLHGFTRWSPWGGFGYEDHSFWTFEREAYFPMDVLRWIATPRYMVLDDTVHKGAFSLHNPSKTDPLRVRVRLVPPADAAFLPEVKEGLYILAPEETVEIPVSVEPEKVRELGDGLFYRIRFDFPDIPGVETYAGLKVTPKRALKELELPLVLKPFQHERRTHDYHPDYPVNEVNFSPENQPYVRDPSDRYLAKGVYTRTENGWELVDFIDALERAVDGFSGTHLGGSFHPLRTAFDGQGGVYTTVNALGPSKKSSESVPVLLFQPSADQPMQAYPLAGPDVSVADIEYFTGHNHEVYPPPVVLYSRLDDPGLLWGYRNKLELILPEREGDALDISNRHLLSENAISLCTHSGAGATVVSVGDKVHVVWGEVAEGPEAKVFPGVPTYIATYDRTTGEMGKPVRIGFAPPINDMHNSPGITVDSQGYLHVILGAHGRFPFHYTRSKQPNDAYSGWTNPVRVLHTGMKRNGIGPEESGAQTYVGLVCDKDDNLHLVFRHDLIDVNGPFKGFNERYRALSHQIKPAGQDWEDANVLIVPPIPNYSIYYHKLTIDRLGRLFLYHSYRPGESVMRSDLPGAEDNPSLWMSEDSGRTWKLVEDTDFLPGN